MAVQGCLRLTLSLLLSLFFQSCSAQNEAAVPEIKTHYALASSSQNEATDDILCLARNTIDTTKQLAGRFNNDTVLSKENFTRLLTDLQTGLRDYGATGLSKHCASSTTVRLESGTRVNCSDILLECPGADEIYSRHSAADGLSYSHLVAALQDTAYTVTNARCQFSQAPQKGYKPTMGQGFHEGDKPTIGQTWGYGIGFVSLVCIISNLGGLLTPLMARTFFQRLLQFLVAMGAGTLIATGLLVLLPEAFDIVSIEELNPDYIWKSATAMLTIYGFFVSERVLKFLMKKRELRKSERRLPKNVEPSFIGLTAYSEDEKDPITSPVENGQSPAVVDEHGHSHFVFGTPGKKRRGSVATVAWLVLMGDFMHKFVDGIAIGAALTENIYLGLSIGIAVLCEELPHELGDVAILLHSGLSMKRALFLNCLTGCMSFVGLVVGILLGENTDANRWILAVAGGLFLYVPLVDMLPDMSQHLDMKIREGSSGECKKISSEAWWTLGCQSVGLLLGMSIILMVINLSGMIVISD